MREIKYRGKRIDNGRWAYGFYMKTPITTEFNCEGQFLDTGKGRTCIIQDRVAHEVDPETIGQFTDLMSDTNETEIYEDDIFRNTIDGKNTLVKMFLIHDWHYSQDIEIIGNKHDNPELIKK